MKEFLFAMLLGAGIGLLAVAHVPGSNVLEYNTAKVECEKSLPRDKQCIMYFKAEDIQE